MKKLLAFCGITSKRSVIWLFIASLAILSLGIYQTIAYTRSFPVHETQWLLFILENGILLLMGLLTIFSLWLLFSYRGRNLIEEVKKKNLKKN
jgi:hypothetical protein